MAELKRTALYESHVEAGGKMVDFAGWELPIHYGSQLAEHEAVRSDAGMFDVSHMLVSEIQGADAKKWLQTLLANDAAKLGFVGKALYSPMLNDNGGVVDDLIVYRMNEEETRYRIVSNAATRDKDAAQFAKIAGRFGDVAIKRNDSVAMIAVQGPNALSKLSSALPDLGALSEGLKPFCARVTPDGRFIARTGYTGEDGCEIIIPAAQARETFAKLLAAGVKPCGLGARDTLRLEAGMNLYGHDMDETTTPWETGLAWTVAMKDDRPFVGREALEKAKPLTKMRQTGVLLEGRGVMRDGMKLYAPDGQEGIVTSGSFSPTLKRSIGIARIPVGAPEQLEVEIRGARIPARAVKLPFVRNGKQQFE